MVDGTNKCAWEGGACVTTSEKLGEGMVGITSVPDEGMGMMPEAGMPGKEMGMPGPPTNDSFCSMPPDTTAADGISCMAYMEMYSYNQTTDECAMVVYGGCGGTENLFGTLAECESAATEFCGYEKKNTTDQTDSATTESSNSTTIDPANLIGLNELGNASLPGDNKGTAPSSSVLSQPQFSISAIVAAFSCWILSIM